MRKQGIGKKFFAMTMTLALMTGTVPGANALVWAEEIADEIIDDSYVADVETSDTETVDLEAENDGAVKYIDENGVEMQVVATPLTGSEKFENALAPGWYVVDKNLDYTNGLQFKSGDVNIILADGCTINIGTASNPVAYGFKTVFQKNWAGRITIYGQKRGRGSLKIYGKAYGIMTRVGYTQNGGNVTIDCANQKNASCIYTDGVTKINDGEFNALGNSNVKTVISGGGFEANGGKIEVTGNGVIVGNRSTASRIVLGYKNSGDTIKISDVKTRHTSKILIADGKVLDNGDADGLLKGEITDTSKINDKILKPHAHDLDYSVTADNATIVASCKTEGCDSEALLTIKAPLHTTVNDGRAETATLEGLDAFNELTGQDKTEDDIRYSKNNSEFVTAPTDAGEYTAAVTVGDKKAYVEYEIHTIDYEDPVPPRGLTAVYGDTLKDVDLGSDEWAWADPATEVGKAGEKKYKAVYTPLDTNYNAVEVDVPVEVQRADNPAEIRQYAKVLAEGKQIDLNDNINLNGASGKVSFSLEEDVETCSVTDEGLFTSGDMVECADVLVTIEADDYYNSLTDIIEVMVLPDTEIKKDDADQEHDPNDSDDDTFPGAVLYVVKVENGIGDGNYEEGEEVEVNAEAPAEDETFDKWTSDSNVEFEDAENEITTFVMPAKDVKATANFKDVKQEEETTQSPNGRTTVEIAGAGGIKLSYSSEITFKSKKADFDSDDVKLTAADGSTISFKKVSIKKATKVGSTTFKIVKPNIADKKIKKLVQKTKFSVNIVAYEVTDKDNVSVELNSKGNIKKVYVNNIKLKKGEYSGTSTELNFSGRFKGSWKKV